MATEQGVGSFRYPIVVLALAGATALGCSEVASPVGPTGVALDRSADAGPLSGIALQGNPALGPELAAVQRATALFHQVERAAAAGYVDPTGGHCDESPAGAMGIHSANPALIQSQALEPEHPEVLLYLPTEGGGMRLIGVEYLQPVLLRNPETGAVAPWLPQEPWPSNYVVITPTPQLFGQTFQGPMPGHVPSMPWHWDLHVWVWANNPSGMFAQWNPALSCAAH
jgi:hypothetical protein